ncbi:MAG: hypothetical protein GKS00_06365 [Alphaproteobacteria bacterium]|nr:hypothetical protein [Alphaproteobacteria bacterium]
MGNLVDDLLPILNAIWRRRWYALALAWMVCLVGWTTVSVLPNKYRSVARVYIDTTSLLGPLLKGIAVETDLAQEVAIMQRTLLSRPNLAEVARATDLDLEATTPIEMDRLLTRIEKSASIRAQGRNLFTVGFTDKNPVLAKAVVQALLTIFVETNLGQNRQDMENARSFIESQLAIYQKQLQESEQRLAAFKAKHSNVLAAGNFTKQLSTANGKKKAAQRQYDDTILKRDQLKAQLAVVPQFLKVQTPPQIVMSGPRMSPEAARMQQLQQNLDQLLLRYTDNHPDVVTTKRVIGHLQAQIDKMAEDTAGSDSDASNDVPKTEIPNTLYEQLQLRISELEPELVTLRRNLSETEEDVARLQELRLSAPEIETQRKDLDRDYFVIKKKFEEFLARREAARISQAAEATTDSVQFRIISPPQVPVVPSAPNRKLLFGAVLALAIGSGVGFTFLLSQIDTTFSSANRLTEKFGLPVLGSVSLIVSSSQQFRRTLSNVSFGTAAGTLLALCGVLLIFAPQLASLPELLQKQPLPGQLSWLSDFIKSVAKFTVTKGI